MSAAGFAVPEAEHDPAGVWRAMYDAAAPAEAAQGEDEAIRDIAIERERQKSVEGWTPQHDDDEHYNCELCIAASCYARHASGLYPASVPKIWPWDEDSWKPKNPRRDLIRAAALIVAEIERLDRALAPKAAQDEIVDAQHDETGRMWRGPRSDIPARFAETTAQPAEAAQGEDLCEALRKCVAALEETDNYSAQADALKTASAALAKYDMDVYNAAAAVAAPTNGSHR
jgi:hypothetical protein